MAKRKRAIPQYGTVTLNGIDYYRTRVQNADGKLVALYARTPEELYDKELGALEQIDNDTFCRKSPTVADYCEKWLLMQSVHVRATTLIDYTSKVRRHIIKELGQMRMADVTLDDIQLALVPVSEKSASVYKSVVILYKSIFRAAKEMMVALMTATTASLATCLKVSLASSELLARPCTMMADDWVPTFPPVPPINGI